MIKKKLNHYKHKNEVMIQIEDKDIKADITNILYVFNKLEKLALIKRNM